MDEAAVYEAAQEHVEAVCDPMDDARLQLTEDLQPQLPAIIGLLPSPVRPATVDSVVLADDHATVLITYLGDDDAGTTLKSQWEDRDGRTQIVEIAPPETQ